MFFLFVCFCKLFLHPAQRPPLNGRSSNTFGILCNVSVCKETRPPRRPCQINRDALRGSRRASGLAGPGDTSASICQSTATETHTESEGEEVKREGVQGATLEEHQAGKHMTKGGLQLKRLLSNGCHLFQLYHPLKATHALNKADVLEL